MFNKDAVKEKIKIILENDKRRILINLDHLVHKVSESIKGKNKFYKFKELYSEYNFKYKILDF